MGIRSGGEGVLVKQNLKQKFMADRLLVSVMRKTLGAFAGIF